MSGETGRENQGNRFDRLPESAADRTVEGRPTRVEVLEYFDRRFDIPADVFDGYTFWEKGNGKIWIFAHETASPVAVEGLGMTCLRTRQEHWKPTTDFCQRFGGYAQSNCVRLDDTTAREFVAGEDVAIEWDGDWGYLIATNELAGRIEPIGVGLYIDGELRSMIPKGRRRQIHD